MIANLIANLAWPIVCLIIILILRKQITKILPNITKVKAGGVELTIEKIVEAKMDEFSEDKFKQPDVPDNSKKMIFQDESTDVLSVEESIEGNDTMLAFTANQSYEMNLRYNIYYDPVERNHKSSFKYIGLYKEGEIFAVGKLMKIAYCNYDEVSDKLTGTNGYDINQLNADEVSRIKNIIRETEYYDIHTGCKFFIVDSFFRTHYTKSSDYPLRAKKYIWLNAVDNFKEGMKAQKLAELLNGKEWE